MKTTLFSFLLPVAVPAVLVCWACGSDTAVGKQPLPLSEDPNAERRCFQFAVGGLEESWQMRILGGKFEATGTRFYTATGERHDLKAEGEMKADGQARASVQATNAEDLHFAQTLYELWRWDEQYLFISDRKLPDFGGDFRAYRVNCPGDTATRDAALFDRVDGFYNGYSVASRNGQLMVINENNQVVLEVPKQYTGAKTVNEESLVVFDETAQRYGIMDLSGKMIVPAKYDNMLPFNAGLAAFVNDKGLWGFMDRQGKIVVQPQFNMLSINMELPDQLPFNEGLAAVGIDGKWGYIDPKGKMVIPMRFGFAKAFENGKAQVYDETGRWIWIDKTGKCIQDCK